MDILLFWIAVSCYAVASACFFVWLVFKREAWGTGAFFVGAAGLLSHALAILLRWADTGHGPYITRYEVFSSNAFILIVLFYAVTPLWKEVRGIGAAVFPFAVLLMGYGALSLDVRAEAPITFKNWWLVIHIFFAKLAMASIMVSTAFSFFYIVKQRRPGALAALGAPDTLEDLGYRFLALSLLFQSVMIIAGAIWAHSSWGRFWGWDPIETWSLITWVSFGAVLHLRRLHGWRGTKGAYLTLGVFLVALFAAYVVVFIAPSVHSSYLVK